MNELELWQRGFGVRAVGRRDLALYLWFYEWTLWDALCRGPHSPGKCDFRWKLNRGADRAHMSSPEFTMEARTVKDGAELTLTVVNQTDYHWPELAGIIPCVNPGGPIHRDPVVAVSEQFVDPERRCTYFVGDDGLQRFEQREIHFNHAYRAQIENVSTDGKFVFSHKWPTSQGDAYGGLIVRESENAGWVGGVAWERYLSAQAHNPWRCMHLSVQLGPLAPGESRTVHGKLYLFEGTKEDCLGAYRKEFSSLKVSGG